MVSQELGDQDLKGCSQIVRRFRKDGRNHVIKGAAVIGRTSDGQEIAKPLGSKLVYQIYFIEPANRIAGEQAKHQRVGS